MNVVATGMGGGDCGYDFRVGTRYVIVGYRSTEDGRMWVSICSMTRPIAEAAGFREYIQSLSAPSKGGALWGRVVTRPRWVNTRDRRGPPPPEPVADVRVSIDGPARRTVTTGSDGEFSFTALPPGTYIVTADAPEHRRDLSVVTRSTVTLDRAYACADVDLWAAFASGIEGLVLTEDGAPARGIDVSMHSADGFDPRRGSISVGDATDASGRYRLEDVPPGRYVAGISIDIGPNPREPYAITYGHTVDGNVEIVIPEGGNIVHMKPMVARRLRPVRVGGIVQWSDGAPASGFAITGVVLGERGPLRDVPAAKTSLDGRFALDLFAGLRYQLSARRGDREIAQIEVVAGDDPVVITLPVP